jgi:hypothetical protein
MLIDIQIKDATPDDLRGLFARVPAERPKFRPDISAVSKAIESTLRNIAGDEKVDKALKEAADQIVAEGYSGILPTSKEVIEKTVNPPHEPRVNTLKQPRQSRKGVPPWTESERVLIEKATDRLDAWAVYKRMFPGKRNSNAVKQRWSKMHPEVKFTVVRGVKAKKPDTRKLGKKGLNVKQSVKAIALSNDVKEPAPSGLPALTLRQKVKHNGLISSPYHHQIGIVERMPPGGDILVKFDNGGTGWIPRGDLVAVP